MIMAGKKVLIMKVGWASKGLFFLFAPFWAYQSCPLIQR